MNREITDNQLMDTFADRLLAQTDRTAQIPKVWLLKGTGRARKKEIHKVLQAFPDARVDFHHFNTEVIDGNSVDVETFIEKCGAVVYSPLLHSIIFYPDKEVLYAERTASNAGITSPELQEKMKRAKFLGVGLSVGASIMWNLIDKGARHIRGFDPDVIEAKNLNRLPPGFIVGMKKAVAMQNWATLNDPYADFQFLTEMADEKKLTKIITTWSPDFIIDECDHPPTKDLLRWLAKRYQVAFLSAADIGQGTIRIDYEAYDRDPNYPPYQGLANHVGQEKWAKLNPLQKIPGAIGLDNVPSAMLESLPKIARREISSFPQEIGAVALSSAGMLEYIQAILLNLEIPPYIVINLPELIIQGFKKQEDEKRTYLVAALTDAFQIPTMPSQP